ncbi:MAG TPA: TRAP transporter substrate-binding protein [Burkholderiales bacterium]|nr:TRAP transporter substrate-binding protein [Burkholderiales bacterium]
MKRLCTILAALTLAAPAAAQQFTMKLSAPTVNDMNVEYMKAMKAGIEPRSNGRIKVEMYPANQLGQIPRTVEGVALGTIEMTLVASGFFVGIDPRYLVFDAAGLFDDMNHGNRVFQDPEIRKRLSQFSADKGIEPLIVYSANPNMVLSHKAIRSLADFKGQKIRVPGAAPLQVEPFRHFGTSALSMPLGEVLPAMQNRTIDGAVAGLTVFPGFRYYDVAKGMTYLPGSYLILTGGVSRAFMKNIGPELEKIVRDVSREAEKLFFTWLPDDVERAKKTWQSNGGELITLPAGDQKRFVDDVTKVTESILASQPAIKAEYDALRAAAQKHRK